MKSILLIMIMFIFNCHTKNNISTTKQNVECQNFIFPIKREKITKITISKDGEEINQFLNIKKIDSVCNKLELSCSDFIKFSSKSKLNFYKNDILIFSVFYSEKHFKYKGTVYTFNNISN